MSGIAGCRVMGNRSQSRDQVITSMLRSWPVRKSMVPLWSFSKAISRSRSISSGNSGIQLLRLGQLKASGDGPGFFPLDRMV